MKQIITILLIATLWLTCGYFAHGYVLGSLTVEFPAQHNEPFPTLWGYGFGPIALVVAYLDDHTGGKHPFLAHERTCQQRWDAFDEDGNNLLGKGYFIHTYGNYDCQESDLK